MISWRRLATGGLLFLASFTVIAGETVFIVNRTVDREDSNLDDGLCRGKNVVSSTQSPGLCTLRAAVNQVNALARRPGMENEQFVIKVRPGLYQLYSLASDGQQEFTDDIGLLNDLDVVAKYFRIEGVSGSGSVPAADERAVIRASHHNSTGFRIFDLDFDDDHAEFEFRDLVLSQGYGRGGKGGAAIACRGGGRIKVIRSRINSHHHDDENGAAINASCDLDVERSSISNNAGNGIVVQANGPQPLSLTIKMSSLVDNMEAAVRMIPFTRREFCYCDGAYHDSYTDLTASISASSIGRNKIGLLIATGTTVVLNSTTMYENRYGLYSRGVFEEEYWSDGEDPPLKTFGKGSPHVSLSFANSAIQNSEIRDVLQENWEDVNRHYYSHGHNRIGTFEGAVFLFAEGDSVGMGAIPALEPVHVDGYTEGFLPAEGSVLLGAGSLLDYGVPGSCTAFDQAGESRGAKCDIGALERDGIVVLPPLEPPSDPGDPEELPPGIPPEADPQDDHLFFDGFEGSVP